MTYWWVNHKQTHRAEIEGGYIWSPKENRDGSKNQTYLNLRPSAFGTTGEQWSRQGGGCPFTGVS